MRRILVATATFGLLGATAAFAQPPGQPSQDQHHHQGQWQGGQGSGQWQGQHNQGGQPQGQQQQPYRGGQPYQGQQQQYRGQQNWQGQQRGQQQYQNGRPDWNSYMRNNPDLQRDYQRNRQHPGYTETQQQYAERHWREHGQAEGRNLPMYQGGQYPNQGRYGQNYQQYDRYRGGDHRDWSRYNRNYSAQRRYRFGSYERPSGWYYRRWSYGQYLPSLFWSSNYWINDYYYFGLQYPPENCVWVRYGDDALLIDRYTGEIIQVVYGLFY